MFSKFSGVESEKTVFSLGTDWKKIFELCSPEQAREQGRIRKFHVAVVQRQLRSVQNSQNSCFAHIYLLFFAVLVAVAVMVS